MLKKYISLCRVMYTYLCTLYFCIFSILILNIRMQCIRILIKNVGELSYKLALQADNGSEDTVVHFSCQHDAA